MQTYTNRMKITRTTVKREERKRKEIKIIQVITSKGLIKFSAFEMRSGGKEQENEDENICMNFRAVF